MSRVFAPSRSPEWVALAPGSGGSAELCVAVHPTPPADGSTPFVVLNDSGVLARTHLGAVRARGGTLLRYLTLRVQRASPRTSAADRAGWTNPRVEEHWARETAAYEKLAAGSIAPEWFHFAVGGKADAPQPPQTYCRHRKVMFAPRDPVSLEVLRDCRDDALLTSAGLSPWSAGTQRLLYGPARAAGGDLRFFSEQPPAAAAAGAKTPPVSSRVELIAGWAEVVARHESLAAKQPDLHRELTATFPCCECPHKAECFADGKPTAKAAERLVDFSFHEFRLSAAELMPLHYDDLCDVLGGRKALPEAVFYRPWRVRPGAAATDDDVRLGRLFSEGGDDGTDLLEVFALKLAAFLEVCDVVAGFYRLTGRPHLNLNPRHLLVDLPPTSNRLPGLWNFRIRLIDPASAVPVPGLAGLHAAPVNRVLPYCATPLQLDTFGARERASFTITELRAAAGKTKGKAAEADGKTQVVGELRGELTDPARFSGKDVIGVLLTGIAGTDLHLVCRVQPAAAGSGNLLTLVSEPITVAPAQVNHLTSLRGVTQQDVVYEVYPAFNVPCDLHSLGVILLRTLLVNDGQDLPSARRALDEALAPFQEWLRGRTAVLPDEAVAKFDEILKSLPRVRDALAPAQMLFASRDRTAGRPAAVPRKLWLEALLAAVRCIPGGRTSLCRDHGDYDAEHPGGKLESLVREVELLYRKVHALLFFVQGRNAEVRAVLGGRLLREAPPADGKARDGDAGANLVDRLARCLEMIEEAARS